MQECPRCGSEATLDPENARALWCLSCWHAWTLPKESRCTGLLPRLMPGLRVLDEHRDLNC
ncbi:hypothetical protein BX264_2880 [Streptomyces sp. 2333.5]|nr:hypothetical protein BX264_2880 [Streptomyces sp. 2333.5]SED14478.1 hypothetical protein SAMN05428943_3020 [Streptomyces sp. 2314.4]SEE01966.1 hypothetical protein SAMN05428942_2983 [Streptomyces sp. 2112.2]